MIWISYKNVSYDLKHMVSYKSNVIEEVISY